MNERIVILGGGFAGVSTARELSKQLRREHRLAAGPQDDGVSVTLISRDNYFVFQPLLADIISGAIETTHVVVPLRRLLHEVEVEVGYIDEIDPINKRISVRRRQSGEMFSVEYDALVVALGSITDFRAVPGMAEHAIGVRTLGDAFYLRNRALAQLEEAANEPDSARRDALLTFVVVCDLVELLAQPETNGALEAHRPEVGARPRHGEQRLMQAAARHRLCAKAVATAKDHGDQRHAQRGACDEHARGAPHQRFGFGRRADHVAGAVDKRDDGQAEGVAQL